MTAHKLFDNSRALTAVLASLELNWRGICAGKLKIFNFQFSICNWAHSSAQEMGSYPPRVVI
jgi:hypothetical protein